MSILCMRMQLCEGKDVMTRLKGFRYQRRRIYILAWSSGSSRSMIGFRAWRTALVWFGMLTQGFAEVSGNYMCYDECMLLD